MFNFFRSLGGGGGSRVSFFAVWAGWRVFFLFGRGRVYVFAVWAGRVYVFCCLGGWRVFFLLFGRGTGVHSLTGLPGSSLSDPTTKRPNSKKKHMFPLKP